MRTAILVSGVVLLGLLGGATGYGVGLLTDDVAVDQTGTVVEQPSSTPTADGVLKTPVPNKLPGLRAQGMRFQSHRFTVEQAPEPPVRVTIAIPRGWELTTSPTIPGEVKFLDPLHQRGVRVESGFPRELTPQEARDKLIGELDSSQPPENDLRILEQSDAVVEGEDGAPREVATLRYTYIPKETRRYVIVRWVATEGDGKASVEMSITGLPQDVDGLGAVLFEATKTVTLPGS